MTPQEAGKKAWEAYTPEERSKRASKNAKSRWSKIKKKDRRAHALKMLKARWDNYKLQK